MKTENVEVTGKYLNGAPAPLYQIIAGLIQARLTCEADNPEWFDNHTAKLREIAKNELPSGSGIDSGTAIDLDESTPEKIVLTTEYHHLNDGGYYDGWTAHKVIITPSLQFGISVKITGRDRDDIKDYLSDVFDTALNAEV